LQKGFNVFAPLGIGFDGGVRDARYFKKAVLSFFNAIA